MGPSVASDDCCESPKLTWRDADDALEVKRKLALAREAGAEGDLRLVQFMVCPEEAPRSLNPPLNNVLMRWQSSNRLELSREGIRI